MIYHKMVGDTLAIHIAGMVSARPNGVHAKMLMTVSRANSMPNTIADGIANSRANTGKEQRMMVKTNTLTSIEEASRPGEDAISETPDAVP
jgi:hypothetical protein